jgi:glycosyltransferase involved in cell wall biosynthesis
LINPKILYIVGQLERGGAEQQLYYLIKHLKPQAQVVSLCQGGDLADPIRGLGIEVVELQRHSSWDLSRLRALVRIVQTYRPEIVHIFMDGPSGLYGRLAALLTGHPCVIVGERRNTAIEPRWYRVLKRLLNNRVAAVVTNSQANFCYLANQRIINQQRLFCIHNGLELDRFVNKLHCLPDGSAWSGMRNRLVVGTVGSLRSVKAPDVFVRVAARVLVSRPDTAFVHVGDGPMKDEIKALSRELGIQDSLLFLGQRQDVPQLLAGMDVFVLTSSSEGMPNAVMEAMAAGLPCVVTDVGDCKELVHDGETGFVVPVGNEEKLAERILLLLRDKALRRHMGLKGRERIQAFDVRRMVEQYKELYQQVLSNE